MVQKITFLTAGHCKQLEKAINPKNGRWKHINIPSSVAVIEHAKEGVLLFDTGYTPRFQELTRHLPEKLYAMVTPVTVREEETAVYQLKSRGIQVADVKNVVLSHFHADHVAGAIDFSAAKFVYSHEEYESFQRKSKLSQLLNAYLPALLPQDLRTRTRGYGAKAPIPRLGAGWSGYDFYGDGSMFVVPLPGHSIGHLGLYLPDVGGTEYLLIGDAAWLRSSITDNVMPIPLARLIFHESKEYKKTLGALHNLRSDIRVVPCHCHDTLTEIQNAL